MKKLTLFITMLFLLQNTIDAQQSPQFTLPIDKNKANIIVFYIAPLQSNPTGTDANLSSVQEIPAELFTTQESGIRTWLINNKYKLSALGVLGAGVTVAYTLIRGICYMNNKHLWSRWHKDKNLEQLLDIDQQELAQQLLTDIKQRYGNNGNELTALITFANELEQEVATLNYYKWVDTLLQPLSRFSFLSCTLAGFSSIPERLQRLAYLKNLFNTWAIPIGK